MKTEKLLIDSPNSTCHGIGIKKPGSTESTIIPLCYATNSASTELDGYFKAAILERHNVLGTKRGVECRMYGEDYARSPKVLMGTVMHGLGMQKPFSPSGSV
jgi:hypothetical protein